MKKFYIISKTEDGSGPYLASKDSESGSGDQDMYWETTYAECVIDRSLATWMKNFHNDGGFVLELSVNSK